VYNLTVEGQPEFYANGVLVHNCVWALTDLMLDERGIPRMITLGSTRVIDPWGAGPDEAARAAAAEALRVKVLTGGYWPQGR
jgi:hypothetical protein